MLRLILIGINSLFILQGCNLVLTDEPNEKKDQAKIISGIPESEGLGDELGTLVRIYPIPRPDGEYDLELQMTQDTIVVAFEEAKAFASDSIGHALFRSSIEPFYTLNGKCFYSPKKEGCLAYTKISKK
jgi:hypothetical protein